MKFEDDTPELGEFLFPYPKNPPIRNILENKKIKGQLIVFEGPDGSGKTTQIKMLVNRLKDHGIKVSTYSYIKSELIKHVMLKGKWENFDPYTSTYIYLTALSDLMNREVLPRLYNGEYVILDRYIYSIIGKGVTRGLDINWFRLLTDYLVDSYRVIYLDTPIEICWKRKESVGETASYWECGMDVFDNDMARYKRIPEYIKNCFITYQGKMKKIIKNELPLKRSLILGGDNEKIELNKIIYDFVFVSND